MPYYIELLDNLLKAISDRIIEAPSYKKELVNLLSEVFKYVSEIKEAAVPKQAQQPDSQYSSPKL